MKEIIDDFISHNSAIAAFIESASESYQDGNEVLPQFAIEQQQVNEAIEHQCPCFYNAVNS